MNTDSPTTNSTVQLAENNTKPGYIYVMTHSIFSDVVKVGSTVEEPHEYAQKLSQKVPGQYHLKFAQQCNNPKNIENIIRNYLHKNACTTEFFEVPEQYAVNLIKREVLRIPSITL
jgi:T5orf172 domain